MTTPLQTPLRQLKTQYPKATLTASLVSINEGQYVVRAAISQDGQEIATGLAASVDVQIAEDKARERAIAILGIESVTTTHQSSVTKAPDSQPATPTAKPASASSKTTPLTQPASENATPTLIDEATSGETSNETSVAEIPPEEDDLGPPIDSVREEALPPPEARPSAATIALENFNTSATPVDLSDVIAQTDVELARLGWTSAQGREYLEKTYGKRSRQQLTDEELMSFLLYLEDIS